MSGSFDPAADAAISFTAGSVAAAGTGAHTIAVLWQSATNPNSALAGGFASGTQVRQFLADSGALFGTGDFSTGYPTGGVVGNTWYVGAITKPAGSAHYRIHLWPYVSAGTGTMDHGESATAANHGDGSALTELRIGLNDVRGNGLIAVVAYADVEMTDGQLNTLKSASLSAWAALPFDEIISLENWNGSTGAVAVVGTSSQSGITGTVSVGANPPGFSFSLATAPAPPPYRPAFIVVAGSLRPVRPQGNRLSTGTVTASASADATVPITATVTADASAIHPVDAATTTTATVTAAAAATHPIATTVAETASVTATAAATHPMDTSVGTTATVTAGAAAVHPVQLAQSLTAAVGATANVTARTGATVAVGVGIVASMDTAAAYTPAFVSVGGRLTGSGVDGTADETPGVGAALAGSGVNGAGSATVGTGTASAASGTVG